MAWNWDDESLVELLCERIIAGESLNQICTSPNLPDKASVYRHMAKDRDFATRIARARVSQQDAIIDDTVDIADSATTAEEAQVAKLRIWARQWRAAKLAPKKYGEKIEMEHSGGVILINDIPDPDYSQRDK